MRKKFIAAIAAALILASCVPFISGCKASVNYVLSEDKTHYIAGCTGSRSSLKGELVIKEEYNELPVTEIAKEGFRGTSITKVVIPASIESIGMAAFGNCSVLTAVEFASGSQLTEIPQGAFGFCDTLKKITLPETVQKIDVWAFWGCESLNEINLHDTSVTEIAYEAFRDCYALAEINLPEGLQTIGICAFYNAGLTEITIPSTVVDTSYTDSDGKSRTRYGIGMGAFHSCVSLKKAVVNAQIETVPSGAFGYCIALEEIYLPSTITKIEGHIINDNGKFVMGHAFHNCSEMTVHFAGTKEQWNAIRIENTEYKEQGATFNNDAIVNAKKEYNT